MKNIKLSIRELGSDVTKFDRTVNEAEFGDASKYVPGRKINLIILVPTVDRRDNEKVVKLSSLELKRAGVEDEYITIQQNKNARALKYVLAAFTTTPNHRVPRAGS
ncbi:hypothetical protein BJV82DRAFT_591896 [Fennellomyces sp. T-0311]|nr:hypothetical protein BJV82DRAFT_591896 [Fennellomyces sp. T-0311]